MGQTKCVPRSGRGGSARRNGSRTSEAATRRVGRGVDTTHWMCGSGEDTEGVPASGCFWMCTERRASEAAAQNAGLGKCEDRVLDKPASGGKGSKGRRDLFTTRDNAAQMGVLYRGTSLIRNCPPLAPYSRTKVCLVLDVSGCFWMYTERKSPCCHSRQTMLHVRTGSWTGPSRGKGAPRVGISSTVFGVRAKPHTSTQPPRGGNPLQDREMDTTHWTCGHDSRHVLSLSLSLSLSLARSLSSLSLGGWWTRHCTCGSV